MKYTLDIPSPQMAALIEATNSRVIQMQAHYHQVQREFGRGSAVVLSTARRLDDILAVREALTRAVEAATPDKAVPTTDAPYALQAGDELALVAGRPRKSKSGERR